MHMRRHTDPAGPSKPTLISSPLQKAVPMCKFPIFTAALIAAALAGCDKKPPTAAQVRPVRTVTVERGAEGETVSLTGQVRAKDQVSLAFRLDGRMLERPVAVGNMLTAGQSVARLDPQNQQNALRSAQASLSSAEAVLTQARLWFGRQQELLKSDSTPRATFDEAQRNLLTAQAQVDSAQAQVRIAQDQLSYTVLFADAPGVVTATGAEPGEVVRAGQTIVRVARRGGRDAVFDVSEQLIHAGPRDPVVQIALTNDPSVRATGRVREVSPQADPATRTFQVKVGIIDPPPAMELGSTVTGSIKLSAPSGLQVPPSALTEADGRPAVWVVDPKSETVSLRNVDVSRYDPADVVVSQGLDAGEIVVTAGVQTLHPGQKVRLLGGAL
jgi:membrane fusion protein, multidrug efflux system